MGMVNLGQQLPHAGTLMPVPQPRGQASAEDRLFRQCPLAPDKLLVKPVDVAPKHPQRLPQALPIDAPLQSDSTAGIPAPEIPVDSPSTAIVPATEAARLNSEGNQDAAQLVRQELESTARKTAIMTPAQKGARRAESLLAAASVPSLDGKEQMELADIVYEKTAPDDQLQSQSHGHGQQVRNMQGFDNDQELGPEPHTAARKSALPARQVGALASEPEPEPEPAAPTVPSGTASAAAPELIPSVTCVAASSSEPRWTPDSSAKSMYTADQVHAIASLGNPSQHLDSEANAQMQDVVVATFASKDEAVEEQWRCTGCNDNNFPTNVTCLKCGLPRTIETVRCAK